MPTRRLTSVQFQALYRLALDPADTTAHHRTLELLCRRGLAAYDPRASLGQPRPRYVLRLEGWQELHEHLSWLARRQDRGRSAFERGLGSRVDVALAALVRARVRACAVGGDQEGALPVGGGQS